MIDAREAQGVPCITTLPDVRTATWVQDVLGVPLTEWQVPLLNR